MAVELDPFESVLSLEDEYYQEGYDLGVSDGSRAGRIEGRVFGLEKGFEKFVTMGLLHAKAAVWASRLPQNQTAQHAVGVKDENEDHEEDHVATMDGAAKTNQKTTLPPLSSNPRLEKHVATLFALAEPESLSTQNTEDAVSDFDDRFKRAQAKAKVIEKLIGESQNIDEELEIEITSTAGAGAGGAKAGPKRAGVKVMGAAEKVERSMEDFGARPGRS